MAGGHYCDSSVSESECATSLEDNGNESDSAFVSVDTCSQSQPCKRSATSASNDVDATNEQHEHQVGLSRRAVQCIAAPLLMVATGGRGALEALIIDATELTWWLLRLSLSPQAYTRFQDQVC